MLPDPPRRNVSEVDAGEGEQILRLVRDALDAFEDVALAATVRRASRIAALRGDSFDALLFRLDLRPSGGSAVIRAIEVSALASDLGYDGARGTHREALEAWMEERRPAKPDTETLGIPEHAVMTGSVNEVENRISALQ